MTRDEEALFRGYMRACAADAAHDEGHTERVLGNALAIAADEPGADRDVLICAALLHDVGRAEQNEDPTKCHAAVGAEKARRFLTEHGYPAAFAEKVAACIASHRYRGGPAPESLEARILFDADKLDVAGAVGVARTLLYQGRHGLPLCAPGPDPAADCGRETFFKEYDAKLARIYDGFLTRRGAELAAGRRAAAEAFRNALAAELAAPARFAADAAEKERSV